MTTQVDTDALPPLQLPEGSPRLEVWTFAGLRRGGDGAKAHCWIDDGGTSMFFRASGSYTIGGRYEVKATRADGGQVTMHGSRHVYVDMRTSGDLRAQWAAEDVAARTWFAAVQRERSDGKTDALATAIEPLIEIARKLRLGADRDAFIAHVMRRLIEAWR